MKLFEITLSEYLPWRMAKNIRTWTLSLRRLLQENEGAAIGFDLCKQMTQVIEEVSVLQRERALEYQRQKQQLEAIINTLSDAVIVTDEQQQLVLANPAWYRLFDASPSCLGQPLLNAVRVPKLFEGLVSVQKTGQSCQIDFDCLGRLFVASLTKLTSSGCKGCLAVVSDVTQIKNTEQIRRDFTANVSHEMKTPLTSILGYSETLLQGALKDPAMAKPFVEIIHNQSSKLKELIDDVMALARIESPAWKINKETVLLSKIVNEVLNEYRAHPKQLVLTTNEFDVSVVSDAHALKHILHNLIDNAVKYTPAGGHISVTVKEEQAVGVRMTIEDTGVGISKNELGRIFERFYRVGGHSTKDGTGLGLAIVKHLVEKLGGSINVASRVGQGSSFSVILPWE